MCGSNFYSPLLAGLWLRLEGCQLVGLPAMSIKNKQLGPREIRTLLYWKCQLEVCPACINSNLRVELGNDPRSKIDGISEGDAHNFLSTILRKTIAYPVQCAIHRTHQNFVTVIAISFTARLIIMVSSSCQQKALTWCLPLWTCLLA